MTITPTAAAAPTLPTSLHTTATPATEAKKTMDKEVFLALLVAQLRNQDPTSPMDTTEMMAQSTQLSSMEQLTAVAETSRESFALQMRVAALGLVGQEVTYVDNAGTTRTGVVSEVSFALDVPMVRVGDATVPLDAVAAARRSTTTAPDPAAPAAPAPSPGTTPGSTEGTTPATSAGDGVQPA
jgi:flagellar basal-body rod modification protein FlgD